MPELDLVGYEPPHLGENDIFSPTTQSISTESSQNTQNSHRRHSNYDFDSWTLVGLRRKFQDFFSFVNAKPLLILCAFSTVILFIVLISVSCSVAKADFEIQETLKKLQSQLVDLESVQLNFSLQLQSEFTSDVTGCGASWIPYKHEKCLKILDRLFTHEEAEAECLKEITENQPHQNLNPKMIPLLTVDSKHEQQFLNRLIFVDSKILDNVWLSAQRQLKGNASIFLWKFGNGTGIGNISLPDVNFHFENWQLGSPSSTLENRCVHMVPNGTRVSGGWSHDVDGQWQDAPCRRRNVVICQKPQVFSLANLKSYFVEFKKETTRKIQSLEKIAGTVPLGFIYIQYRNQSAPSDLWPLLTWEDVTEFYSGEFFRALGNDSSSFGQIQSENAPRVTKVTYKSGVSGSSSVNLPVNGESGNVNAVSGFNNGYSSASLSFFTSGGEVRPKNSAVRIWKRI